MRGGLRAAVGRNALKLGTLCLNSTTSCWGRRPRRPPGRGGSSGALSYFRALHRHRSCPVLVPPLLEKRLLLAPAGTLAIASSCGGGVEEGRGLVLPLPLTCPLLG